jgi:hypothetical protein
MRRLVTFLGFATMAVLTMLAAGLALPWLVAGGALAAGLGWIVGGLRPDRPGPDPWPGFNNANGEGASGSGDGGSGDGGGGGDAG